ncbi:MAG TPA: bifunctional UDP-sugar hydrolase/5'-nucleotidase [Bryobacteraceae bacterium]|nr:bifunctional UDP-sugar hydrolase/5'-nucleotidase [Bryobacteraceae bacterium]
MFRRIRRTAALLLLACATLAGEIRSLTILHLNDLHAHISPANGHGGFAYLAAIIKHERDGCLDCILLNGGDLVQGSPVSTIFRGEPIYQLANLLGFDAACLGNHEFDYGWAQAAKFTKIATFPIVTANIVNAAGGLITPKPYVILKVNGLRVAVIGGMTDSLKTLSTPKSLGEWHTIPVVETVRKYAQELRGRSDLVVLLAHIDGNEENAILHTVPEIPVSVTGHIHSGLSEAMSYDERVLVRVRSYGEELGRLDLQVDTEKKAPVSWKWKRISVDDAAVEPDPVVAREVQVWEDKVSAEVDRPLAVAARAFDKTEVKRIIERAMRDETHSDFAWMNSGGIRATLPQGQLLDRHIWNIMPFDNDVVIGTFKGRDLPKVVAGDRKIDPERDYTLAVSDYTAANQQTAENLQTTGLAFPRDAGLLRNILLDWFRKQKVIDSATALDGGH